METLQSGTITKLEVQKRNTDRVSVFIDETFAFGVHQDVVVKHGLRTGQALNVEEQRAIIAEEELVRAKQRAFDYLAYKPRTEAEVRRKLRRQDHPEATIDQVIERMYELGYLDDEAYARDYVHNRFSNKGYGPVRIQMELKDRGVDRHIAEAAVQDLFETADPLDAAREKAEKRWPRLAREDDPRKRKDKLYRYLKRRGYTYDTIRQVIDEMEARLDR